MQTETKKYLTKLFDCLSEWLKKKQYTSDNMTNKIIVFCTGG